MTVILTLLYIFPKQLRDEMHFWQPAFVKYVDQRFAAQRGRKVRFKLFYWTDSLYHKETGEKKHEVADGQEREQTTSGSVAALMVEPYNDLDDFDCSFKG